MLPTDVFIVVDLMLLLCATREAYATKLAACCVRCERQWWSLQVDFSLVHLAF